VYIIVPGWIVAELAGAQAARGLSPESDGDRGLRTDDRGRERGGGQDRERRPGAMRERGDGAGHEDGTS
jgi:hypothetical protein